MPGDKNRFDIYERGNDWPVGELTRFEKDARRPKRWWGMVHVDSSDGEHLYTCKERSKAKARRTLVEGWESMRDGGSSTPQGWIAPDGRRVKEVPGSDE